MRNRATIICARNDSVLLVAKTGARWSLPGGKAEGTESWIDTARRELEEETAMVARQLTWLFQFGGANTVHHVFAAQVPEQVAPRPCNEIARCRWFRVTKLAALDVSVSTKSIVGIAFAIKGEPASAVSRMAVSLPRIAEVVSA